MKHSGGEQPALCTVMVADDQLMVAEGLARLLAAVEGCQIKLVTSDVLRLMSAAEDEPPGLVVIDTAMAQSLRVARALATRCPRTKVILLDEFRLEAHLQRAIDCGAAGYLTKCDAPADLTAAVRKVLTGALAFPGPLPIPPPLPPGAPNTETMKGNGPHGLSLLTRRELEVLTRLAEGLKVRDVARSLGISANTVENHKAHVMRKLGLHKNVELARFAIRHGLVSDD
ncbi:MAG TPA: response regulator transcription factor [Pirellulales bacterium]